MKIKCAKKIEGFTVGKVYKLIGCGGGYLQIKDDNNTEVIVHEIYFENIK